MKGSENIEKLFQDTFEHFEPNVNPQVWSNVQSAMNAPAAGTASVASKFAVGKIIAGVVSVAVVSGGIYYAATKETKVTPSTPEKNQTVKEVVMKQEETAPVITQAQPEVKHAPSNPVVANNAPGIQPPPAVRNLNHYTPDYSPVQQTRIAQTASDNAVYSDVSAIEGTATTPAPEAKYGPATPGMGGMIRGMKTDVGVSTPGSSGEPVQEDPDAPRASIFFNTSSGDAPLTVNFIAQGATNSVSWDFGDGSSSRESDPSHTFTKPGNYVVELSAKNGHGSSTDKVVIEVKATSAIGTIPNIFTPNGDGENDVFFFEMKNITSVGVAIISQQTGELITQWNNLDGNWNGKLRNGADAPGGIYFYSIQAMGADGTTYSKKGFVTITR